MKKLIFAALVLSLVISMSVTAFAEHWADIPLKYMTDNGFLQNADNPDDPITRLEVVKALVKLPLIDKGSNYIFTDTCDKDVIKVAKSGLMSGYGNNIFGINDNITREAVAKILATLIVNATSYEDISFEDKDAISGWALPYVSALVKDGVICGYSDNTFCPQGTVSYAEFAAMFMQIRDKYTISTITSNIFTNAQATPLEFLSIPSGYVGVLTIPSLGLSNLPVVEDGENLDNIKTQAGHFINTALFDGNVGILGHNFRDKSPWFGKLADIQEGSTITWKTKFGVRNYKVTSRKNIAADDWSGLLETGDNRITLITCLAGQSQTHRIMVVAIEEK